MRPRLANTLLPTTPVTLHTHGFLSSAQSTPPSGAPIYHPISPRHYIYRVPCSVAPAAPTTTLRTPPHAFYPTLPDCYNHPVNSITFTVSLHLTMGSLFIAPAYSVPRRSVSHSLHRGVHFPPRSSMIATQPFVDDRSLLVSSFLHAPAGFPLSPIVPFLRLQPPHAPLPSCPHRTPPMRQHHNPVCHTLLLVLCFHRHSAPFPRTFTSLSVVPAHYPLPTFASGLLSGWGHHFWVTFQLAASPQCQHPPSGLFFYPHSCHVQAPHNTHTTHHPGPLSSLILRHSFFC